MRKVNFWFPFLSACWPVVCAWLFTYVFRTVKRRKCQWELSKELFSTVMSSKGDCESECRKKWSILRDTDYRFQVTLWLICKQPIEIAITGSDVDGLKIFMSNDSASNRAESRSYSTVRSSVFCLEWWWGRRLHHYVVLVQSYESSRQCVDLTHVWFEKRNATS